MGLSTREEYYDIPRRQSLLCSPAGIRFALDALPYPSRMNEIVESFVCGFRREGLLMAAKLEHFLLQKLPGYPEEQIRPEGYHYDAGLTLEQLAICQWLRANKLDQCLLTRATDHYVQEYSKRKKDMAHILPTCCLAQRYHDVIQAFHQPGGLKPPASAKTIKCPGKMAYILSQHALRQNPDRDTVILSLDRFLRYYFSNGLYLNATINKPENFPVLLMLSANLKGITSSAVELMESIRGYIRTSPPK